MIAKKKKTPYERRIKTIQNIYSLTLSYDGTAYQGFQVQKQKPTIQLHLENALKKILGESLRVVPSGRTDTGVHALDQRVHFCPQTTKALERLQNLDIAYKLNCLLPDDIKVLKCKKETSAFHARHSRSKIYRYHIHLGSSPNPFLKNYCWTIASHLNENKMKKAAEYLTGKHDFSSFCASDSHVSHKVRELTKIKFSHKSPSGFLSQNSDQFISIDFEGTGFLKQMVRNLVGTLVVVGQEKIPPAQVKSILKAKDRRKAHVTAPPQGLFLIQVKY